MPVKRKRKLALDSDPDSDTDSDSESDTPLITSAPRSNQTKGKNRRKSASSEEEEVDSALIENSQAGLKTKSNGLAKDKKGKGKAKEKEKEKLKGKSNGKGKGKAREVESESDEEEEEDDEDESLVLSVDEGTLYSSDAEPGFGKWTTVDQKDWQEPADSVGDFTVDIVIRWRWHKTDHYPLYRVKWEDYADYHNSWLPIDCFGGTDIVDDFWKDLEFDGTQRRPPRWDIRQDDTHAKLKKDYDTEDVEIRLSHKDQAVRQAARREKRRDIRKDRVEMRKAYQRRRQRDDADKLVELEKKEKAAEARRRKKREEEEAIKRKLQETGKKTMITHGVKVIQQGSSKAAAAVPSTASKVKSIATTSKLDAPSAARDVDDTSTKIAFSLKQRELAAQFLPDSDAKIKADRRQAKEGGTSIRVPALKTAPSIAPLPLPNVERPTSSISTSNAIAAQAVNKITTDSTASSQRNVTSTAVRGGATAGSFKGKHLNRRRIQTFDPLNLLPPKSTGTAGVVQITTNGNASSSQASHHPITSGWDDPVTSSVPDTSATTRPALPMNPSMPRPQFARPSSMQAPLPPPLGPRGVVRMGKDPRARPSAMPSSSSLSNTQMVSPMSPFGPMANTSPLHPNLSPMHPNESSREGMNGGVSSILDQRGIRDQARRAIDERWQMESQLRKRIAQSYNLLCPRPQEDKDSRYLLDGAINILNGGVIRSLEARHKEANRSVNAWVFNARVRLTPVEIEALKLSNVRFYEYESIIQEIWPVDKGRVVMYTLGALMIMLVEQIFEKKEKAKAWEMEAGTSIIIHPWQKAVLSQLIDSDRVEEFLRQVTGMTSDVPDKGFDVVESGMEMLNDLEEVPSEFTVDGDAPDVTHMELRRVTQVVDKEVSTTLHRLQYEWRYEKRMFTLITAKTRLDSKDIPTAYIEL